MDFRTEHTPRQLPFTLTHATRIVTTGSCFATAMGHRLQQAQFRCLVNPFGTVYNPVSIHGQLVDALAERPPHPDLWVARGTRYLHHTFHSYLHASDPTAYALRVADQQAAVRAHLAPNCLLILTYGTAWVYVKQGQVVANCHKVPAKAFTRELLPLSRMEESFDELMTALQRHAPGVQVLLTVSPVRHLREGVEENAVSKATLRLACHALTRKYAQAHYFAAYELLLDDLRDYRFYTEDLVHPTAAAEGYIWEKFKRACMDERTLATLAELAEGQRFLAHRPMDEDDRGYQTRRATVLARMREIEARIAHERQSPVQIAGH
ncbi:MAG: GSCFA domain-containing protein [Cyclobacteriaceae bacterium]|jgi:hypothetical protein|nr:GSCFA domain-containing protein [Cyclobacteriaceae bacterium]